MRQVCTCYCLCVSVVFGPLGCGDDTEPADDGGADDVVAEDVGADADADGDADADAEAEAEADVPTATLTVLVIGTPLWANDPVRPPIEDAAVALDLPGGGRTEATTVATGHVEFTGLDWTAGTADVTAWAEGYGLASLVELDGTEAEVTLLLPNLGDPLADSVNLTVNCLNLPPGATECDAGGEYTAWVEDFTPPYSMVLTVASGRTFDLLAAAQRGWTSLPNGFDDPFDSILLTSVGPYTADATLEIDFAAALPLNTADGSLDVPPRADSPLRDLSMYGWVHSSYAPISLLPFWPTFGMTIGAPSHAERSADGNRWDYEMNWIAPPGVTSPVVVYALRDPSGAGNGRRSWAFVDGYPTEGAQEFTLLDLPNITSPATLITAHPLHGEPFEWELFDTGVTPTLWVVSREDMRLWSIVAPTDATELSVPEPPSTVDMATVLGTARLNGVVELVAYDRGAATVLLAQSELFIIQP